MENLKSWVCIASLTFFMQSLDTTMLYLAVPAIAKSLQLQINTMEIVVICYMFTVVIFTPVSSWIIDKCGEQKAYLWAVSLFALGSLFCALSISLWSLVLWRIVQGIGGALMLPASRVLILKMVSPENKIKYLNKITILGLCGTIMGPLLAGWCITFLSWQCIFLINLPLCLFCGYLAGKRVISPISTEQQFDLHGYALIAPALLLVMCGLMGVSHQYLSLPGAMVIFCCALALMGLYGFHHKKTEQQLFVLSLLKIPAFSVSIVSSIALRTFLSSIPLVLSLMMQTLFNFDPTTVAITMFCVAAGAISAKIVVERILAWLGYRHLLVMMTLLTASVVFSLRLLTAESPLELFGVLAFTLGMLSTLLFSVINFLSFSELTENTYSAGNSLLTLIQLIAIMLSITLSFAILNFVSQSDEGYNLNNFHNLFLLMSAGILLCSVIFIFLKNNESYSGQ
ncbi:MFS transporter [Edaphovirga cremea]|uniref:MFS transporter n=1 Tax=Edaphovirga cremea TaxID=2267246 RepID=UPI00398A4FA8